MADETVIIEKIGTLFLGGPPLVQAATGEVVTPDQLGGAKLHCEVSGCTDYFATSEDEAIEDCKDIMASLNMKSYWKEVSFYEEPMFDTNELQAIAISEADKSALPIHKIIARIVDGSRFREFKPSFGPTLVTGFAHIHGILVGIIANDGALSNNSCLKGSHFVEMCCQRNIPIVFLQNIVEANGLGKEEAAMLIKEKAKMMSVIANSQIPKITVIIGNSYGMDNYVMCGRSMSPRFLYMWPAAKVAMVNPEVLRSNEESAETMSFIDRQCSSYYSTARVWDDGIILPQDTRKVLGLSLKATLKHKEIEHSPKNVIRM